MKKRTETRISDVKNLHFQNMSPCWMRGHAAASCYIPWVSFSPGSRLERRGCAAVCCCAAQLLTSDWIPSPPSISPLVPRKDGRVYLRWAPLKSRQNAVGRDWGGLERRQVESLGASVMFATGDCRNLPTCLREHSLTGALLERRNKWSLEWIHSATEETAVLGLVLPNNKAPQSRSSKGQDRFTWPGFASFSFPLKRNSCAGSFRGQYARMGPLQYLFLFGLLYTKTDGKFMK